MKQLYHLIVLLSGILLLASSCKQQETLTVTERTEATAGEDTVRAAEPDAPSAPGDPGFNVLAIGEISPIPTLDPLHAENGAALRAVQLIYEGLFRYDADGNPRPLLAEDWELSDDSLTWRFTVDTDLFYHDSPIFSNGLGRRFRAGDVKFAFQRMAWNNLPPHAARMFMPIRGFQPFYSEQHTVHNPELRRLRGVSGIEVPDDSTVVFRLTRPDPDFIHKLASPYAVIYPPEAITSPFPSRFPAVGTGPYRSSRRQGDSLLIFSRNPDYHGGSEGLPNRVDQHIFDNESKLFRSLATGSIQLIPQAGPQTLGTVLERNGELSASYTNRYRMDRSEFRTHYRLHYHEEGPLTWTELLSLASSIDSAAFAEDFPYALLELRVNRTGSAGTRPEGAPPRTATGAADQTEADSAGQAVEPAMASPAAAVSADTIYTTFSDDLYLRNFITHWSNNLRSRGHALQMIPLRAATRNTALRTEVWIPQYPGDMPEEDPALFIEWTFPRVSIFRNSVRGLELNRYPWWIDIRNVQIEESGGEQP